MTPARSALSIAAASVGPSEGRAVDLLNGAARSVRALAERGASLVVLPELFALPYYAEGDPRLWTKAAEPLDGPTMSWATNLAASQDVALVFGMALEDGSGGKPTNAAVLVEPRAAPRIVAEKIHFPPRGPGGFGEADHFRSGDPRIATFDRGGFRFAAVICFDRRFPETWRAAARMGVDVVLVLVAGPADTDPDGQFEAELRTHARANALYALSAARFGTETVTGAPVRHDGETIAVGPSGRRLAGGRTALVALDRAELEDARDRNPTHLLNRLAPA